MYTDKASLQTDSVDLPFIPTGDHPKVRTSSPQMQHVPVGYNNLAASQSVARIPTNGSCSQFLSKVEDVFNKIIKGCITFINVLKAEIQKFVTFTNEVKQAFNLLKQDLLQGKIILGFKSFFENFLNALEKLTSKEFTQHFRNIVDHVISIGQEIVAIGKDAIKLAMNTLNRLIAGFKTLEQQPLQQPAIV